MCNCESIYNRSYYLSFTFRGIVRKPAHFYVVGKNGLTRRARCDRLFTAAARLREDLRHFKLIMDDYEVSAPE